MTPSQEALTVDHLPGTTGDSLEDAMKWAASQEAREYPPLPRPTGWITNWKDFLARRDGVIYSYMWRPDGKPHPLDVQMFTAEQVYACIDADRKARQQDARAWVDVLAERRRQVEAEGWTAEHDDEHDSGEMAGAASAYALAAADKLHPMSQGDGEFDKLPPAMWPWDYEWWKPGEPRRMLVKAGALILAEIERLDRAAIAKGEQSHE